MGDQQVVNEKRKMFGSHFPIKFKKIEFIRIVLLFAILFLLLNAYIFSVDHQDQWVLNGIEFPYFIFIILYVFYFYSEKRYDVLILFAVIIRMTFVLIPSFKYLFFLGKSIDQHIQFSLAKYIINDGGFARLSDYRYGSTVQYYIGFPFLHLFFGIFSIFLGIPLENTFKYLPVLLNTIYPLLTYYIVKNLKMNKYNDLFKYSIFISSVPISVSITYIITGSMFVFIFSYYVLSQIIQIMSSSKSEIKNVILFILFILGAIFTHSLFTLHFLILISVSIFILYVSRARDKIIKNFQQIETLIFIAILIDITWIIYKITPLKMLKNFLRSRGMAVAITPTFSTLYKINLISTLKIILLYYGSDIFISAFIIISIITIYLKKKKLKNYKTEYDFFKVIILLIWCFSILGFVFGISSNYWQRVFRISYLIYPFLYAIFLAEFNFTKIKKYVELAFFSSIIILSSLQFYACPLLIPSASSVSPDLPSDEPLVYKGMVNSIYQREMISYAEKNVRGRIVCDKVTRNQIFGLTKRNFSSAYLTWYYPPNRLIYPDMKERNYRFLLIHLPGVSGSFEERAIVRTTKIILNMIYDPNHDIIYTNSESFILLKR